MISNQIDNMIIQATKDRSPVLEVYKSIKCEFVNAQKTGITLDEAAENKILLKMVAQRRDSIEQYSQAGRQDLVDNEKFELDILEHFVPKQPTDEEVRQAATQEIDVYLQGKPENYELTMRDLKPIMSVVQSDLPLAPGKIISSVFRETVNNTKKFK